MSFTSLLKDIAVAIPAGIAVVTLAPVFGAAGAITAAGVAVGSALGTAAAIADSLKD